MCIWYVCMWHAFCSMYDMCMYMYMCVWYVHECICSICVFIWHVFCGMCKYVCVVYVCMACILGCVICVCGMCICVVSVCMQRVYVYVYVKLCVPGDFLSSLSSPHSTLLPVFSPSQVLERDLVSYFQIQFWVLLATFLSLGIVSSQKHFLWLYCSVIVD